MEELKKKIDILIDEMRDNNTNLSTLSKTIIKSMYDMIQMVSDKLLVLEREKISYLKSANTTVSNAVDAILLRDKQHRTFTEETEAAGKRMKLTFDKDRERLYEEFGRLHDAVKYVKTEVSVLRVDIEEMAKKKGAKKERQNEA